ncbi:hypothetical protein LTS08_004016 [Lithohypha guttulata]|nr:hypothetical protein LTS08_004016 [Lithohypha guttulata]
MSSGQAETQSQSVEATLPSRASPPTSTTQERSTSHGQHEKKAHPQKTPKQIAETTTTNAEETSSSGTSTSNSDTDTASNPGDTDISIHTNPAALLATTKPPNTDIHNRLTSFFSQLAEKRAHPDEGADEVIEHGTDSDSGYEEDDDGKQYVELDLALGVLSEGEGRDEVDVEVPEDDGLDEDGDGVEGSDEQGASDVLQDLKSIVGEKNETEEEEED